MSDPVLFHSTLRQIHRYAKEMLIRSAFPGLQTNYVYPFFTTRLTIRPGT